MVPKGVTVSVSSLVRRLSSERGDWKFPKSAASYCILEWEYINDYTESCISALAAANASAYMHKAKDQCLGHHQWTAVLS